MDGWNVGLCKGVRRSVFCMVCTYRLISRRLCPGSWCQPTQHQLPGHNLRLIKRYVQTIQKTEHNKIILKKHTNRLNKDDEKLCNCRQRVNCPTDGTCLTRSVVYKAEVTSTDNNTTQTYIGVTANDLKSR